MTTKVSSADVIKGVRLALQVVLDLARQNIVNDPDQQDLRDEQLEACFIVEGVMNGIKLEDET